MNTGVGRSYSQLRYTEVTATVSGDALAPIVALHGDGGGLDDLLPLARTLAPGSRIIAPEAARGVYLGLEIIGRTWFGGTRQRPEPASFGDSLAQLERFIHDVRERAAEGEPSRPWLLGYDQGAVLALSLGIIAPDLIGGVMAICGGLPTFSDPTLLAPVESDLPVLIIGDCADGTSEKALIETTERRLAHLGNRVTVRWVEGAAKLGDPVTHELLNWFQNHRDR